MPVSIANFVFQCYQARLAASIKGAIEVFQTIIHRFLAEANAIPYKKPGFREQAYSGLAKDTNDRELDVSCLSR